MSLYRFEADDFAFSDSGIHLLRCGHNYKTLLYSEVIKALFKRSPEIKNAPLIFASGVLLIAFAIYQGRWVLDCFTNPGVYRIAIESVVLPVLPLLFGVYCVYVSLRRQPVMIVATKDFSCKLALAKFIRENQLPEVELYLRKHLVDKLVVQNLA